MEPVTRSGKTLLKEVQKNILASPTTFDMHSWVSGKFVKGKPPCGTTCCIGGWVCALTMSPKALRQLQLGQWGEVGLMSFEVEASTLIFGKRAVKEAEENGEELPGQELFYAENWPSPYRDLFNQATDDLSKAYVAAARIQYLLETGD